MTGPRSPSPISVTPGQRFVTETQEGLRKSGRGKRLTVFGVVSVTGGSYVLVRAYRFDYAEIGASPYVDIH